MNSSSVVVCISSSRSSKRVILAAATKARQLNAPLVALHIYKSLSVDTESRPLNDNIRIAKALGAEIVFHSDGDVAHGILRFADTQPIATIFIGRSAGKQWLRWLRKDTASQVSQRCHNIDTQMINTSSHIGALKRLALPLEYLISVAAVLAVTGLMYLIQKFVAEADIIMAYLAIVIVLAYSFNRAPALFSALLSVAAFDFFFVPPFYTFAVDHEKYLISFTVMAIIGFMFSTYSAKLKQQLHQSSERESHLRDLYQLARSLAAASSDDQIYDISRSHFTTLCDADISFCRFDNGTIEMISTEKGILLEQISASPMRRCIEENQEIKQDSKDFLETQYHPMGQATLSIVAVIRFNRSLPSEQRYLVQTYLSLINLAITRTQLSDQASYAQIQAESEQLRNAVLSAVSHDLRTPLGTIMGLVSTLLDEEVKIPPETTTEFLDTIYNVTEQLSQKVTNLLQMSRNMRGNLRPKLELQNPEELIGGILSKMDHRLKKHAITTDLDDTLLIPCDLSLMEVVLSNLLDNAIKFSPEGSTIHIRGRRLGQAYELSVRDQGRGLQNKDGDELFKHFYQADHQDVAGTGLGLAISKAIIKAHNGQISAADAPVKGAIFAIKIPFETIDLNELAHE